ncbi:hypothetical protein ACQ856_18350 [Mycolicibacterium psychrotolerans]|uniref:hypothetical protein n=1 Tax=Mycolicibacterium psychrotolerans TaxID=216929 RepID=UPI003D674C5F
MAASYTVVSDRLHVVKDGRRKTFYRGDKLPAGLLNAEQVERFKSLTAIAPSADDAAEAAKADPGAPNPAEVSDPDAVSTPLPTGIAQPQASEIVPVVQSVPLVEDPDAPAAPVVPLASDIVAQQNSAGAVKRPARAATVEAWRKYATDSGQLTADEAEGKSKEQLRELLK